MGGRRGRGRDLVQTSFYPICTISTTLASNKIDEDTFISNFLQNQYPTDVRIEGINNENEYEKYVDKKRIMGRTIHN
jgi:hypothetical protein